MEQRARERRELLRAFEESPVEIAKEFASVEVESEERIASAAAKSRWLDMATGDY